MSERTIVVCDQTGVEITEDMFRISATVSYGGGEVGGQRLSLDFASAEDCAAYVLLHDPQRKKPDPLVDPAPGDPQPADSSPPDDVGGSGTLNGA